MTRVQAVITNPFFDKPLWLPKAESLENAYLSKNSSAEDVVIFLTVLCGMNDIDINKEPNKVVKELINTDEIVLSGGIAFESHSHVILPSCCCGLEQWKEVLDAVINKKSAWLGHDPFPSIEYLDQSVRIWSDDYYGVMNVKPPTEQEKQKMFFIEYNDIELIEQLESIEDDLLDFFKYALVKQLSMVNAELLDKFFLKYCEWLSLEIK